MANGTKIYTTGILKSTKYNRVLLEYPNQNPAGTYQSGTIGEFTLVYFPDEPNSVDCPNPCDGSLGVSFTVESTGPTTASVTANPINGVAPYTYLWSNGQTTQTATGLDKGTEYTVTVTDADGCTVDGAVTPNVEVLTGLKIEMMYFQLPTAEGDIYAPRPCGTGTHQCNRARFDVLANGTSIGIANLNNAGGTSIPDGTIDDHNTPPGYPSYVASDPLDRYWGKTITGIEAAEIADETGTVKFTLTYTGIDNNPHSDAAWIRITKEDGTILASECVNAFDEYIFNPYE